MRVCFVTPGIFPFADGSAQTLYSSLLNTYIRSDCDYHLLLYGARTVSDAEFHSIYPNVTLHSLSAVAPNTTGAPRAQMDDPGSFDSVEAWTSYVIMRKLEQIEGADRAFDIIEFVDTGGPAFFTIQQKRLGRSFKKTDLVVRLHGTASLLRRFESRPWLYANMPAADIEQQAVTQADYCVSHLLANAKAYQSHYKLSDAWLSRVRIEQPPVEIRWPAFSTITVNRSTNLCFSSSLREANRPGLFLAGACEFMSATPDYIGVAFFTETNDANSDNNAIDAPKSNLPASLGSRVMSTTCRNDRAREKIVSESVVVFSSIFETFCFKAVEASLSGAVVVLNELNPAFGADSFWRDGVNCLKFDGSIDGLTSLLQRIFNRTDPSGLASQLRPIEYRHTEIPYWLETSPAAAGQSSTLADVSTSPVSIIICVRDSPQTLMMQLQDLAELSDRSYDIILVDRTSQDQALQQLFGLLAAGNSGIGGNHTVRILRRTEASNYAAAVNAGIAAARYSIVAILPGGQRDTSRFICTAADTIAAARADVVLPTLRILSRSDDLDVTRYWSPLGGALRTNLFANRFGFGCFVARRDILLDQRFDESLGGEWTWDVLQRLTLIGKILAVDPNRGVSFTEDDLVRWSVPDEAKRRALVETIRRNAFHVSRQFDLPWEYLGDGELTSSEWYISPDSHIALKQKIEKHRVVLERGAEQHRRALEEETEKYRLALAEETEKHRLALEEETEKHRREIENLEILASARREQANEAHLMAIKTSEASANTRLEEERQQHQETKNAYAALANARTVRLALKLANFAKRVAGW